MAASELVEPTLGSVRSSCRVGSRLVAAGFLAAGLSVPFAAPASAATSVPPGSVRAVPDPGVTLAVPADDRINGYRFAAHLLGAATGADVPSLGLLAVPGQRLWVFGLRWTADQIPDDPRLPDTSYRPASVTATVVYDGQRTPVPLTQPAPMTASVPAGTDPAGADSGPEYFVASVPTTAADVVVELSSGGYAQDFSLTHMSREGDQPAALYRDPRSWQTVITPGAERDLPTPFSDGNISLPDAELIVRLSRVSLSYFGPDGTSDPAPGAGQAWLVPELQDPPQPRSSPADILEYQANVTASDLTLTIPGQAPIHPRTLPGGPDPLQPATDGSTDGDSEVFPYIYAFPVPAGLTSATLTVDIPPQPTVAAFNGTSPITTSPGRATFPLTLPPVGSPTPAVRAARTPAVISATSVGSPRPGAGHSGTFGGAAVVVATAVAAALAALLLIRRRTHPLPAAPVPASPVPAAGDLPSDGWVLPPTGSESGSAHQPAADDQAPRGRGQPSPPAGGLLAAPPARPPLATDELEVQVLGPVQLSGWPADRPQPGRAALELLVYMALHPGRLFTAEQLRNTIGRGRPRDLDLATIRRYIGELRRSLGERLPEARPGGGYQVVGVATDAGRLESLMQLAQESGSPAGRASELVPGLALVRGFPFADCPEGTFGWAFADDSLAMQIAHRVLTASVLLADLAIDAGDPELALWATGRGFRVWPTDESLEARALTAAAMVSPSRLAQTWVAIEQRAQRGEGGDPSPRSRALFERLRGEQASRPHP